MPVDVIASLVVAAHADVRTGNFRVVVILQKTASILGKLDLVLCKFNILLPDEKLGAPLLGLLLCLASLASELAVKGFVLKVDRPRRWLVYTCSPHHAQVTLVPAHSRTSRTSFERRLSDLRRADTCLI